MCDGKLLLEGLNRLYIFEEKLKMSHDAMCFDVNSQRWDRDVAVLLDMRNHSGLNRG